MAALDGVDETISGAVYHRRRAGARGEIQERQLACNEYCLHRRGRSDASGCNLAQPNFAQEMAQGNVSFRIPDADVRSGDWLENTPDSALQANLAANQAQKQLLGIAGVFTILAAMTARSPALVGRHRTNRC